MAFSIQTNVNAMNGQENLRVNQEFQSRTINRLTSGYRINSSADDAAGLSVANKYRNDVTSLMQGVRNANDGISTLQIVDGGVNNISKILDRMTTLATQAATETFEGDRAILDTEYQTLIGEINRQAANVGLDKGGKYNTAIDVFIGGAKGSQSNAQVSVDLSAGNDAVDSTSLGLSGTTILGGGKFLSSAAIGTGPFVNNGTQSFEFHFANDSVKFYATVGKGAANGSMTTAEVVDQLNQQLQPKGIVVSIDAASNKLAFSSSKQFTAVAGAVTGGGTAFVAASTTAQNDSQFRVIGQATFNNFEATETVDYVFTTASGKTETIQLNDVTGATLAAATTAFTSTANKAKLDNLGISVLYNAAGTGLEFQSKATFTVKSTGVNATDDGIFGANTATTGTVQATTSPLAGSSEAQNSLDSLSKLQSAVTGLSQVSGKIGTGLNKLSYSIQLAQSQIANFSAAESRIRDADVAAEAANLTKAQVLQQASMAAMAQANSAPQAILALLRG